MTVTATATVQSGNRVLISIDGLAAETPAVAKIIAVRRNAFTADPVFSAPVRGTSGVTVVGSPMIVIDQEAPFGSTVSYTVSWVRSDSSIGTATSNTVRLDSTYPRLSDPLTGEFCEFTVEQWPEIAYEYATVVLDVHADQPVPAPVVITGPVTAGASTIVIRHDTTNSGGPAKLRRMLANGAVLLLRASCPTVEGYIAVTALSETRVTQDPSDGRRRHTLTVRMVTAPNVYVASTPPTLADLADFETGTLADLASDFATLRDIAVSDLGA